MLGNLLTFWQTFALFDGLYWVACYLARRTYCPPVVTPGGCYVRRQTMAVTSQIDQPLLLPGVLFGIIPRRAIPLRRVRLCCWRRWRGRFKPRLTNCSLCVIMLVGQ